MTRTLQDIVESFLKRTEQTFFRGTGGELLLGNCVGNGMHHTLIGISERERHLSFDVAGAVPFPSHLRLQICEWVARANRGQSTGRFDFDMDEGVLTFTTGIYVGNSILSDDTLDRWLSHGQYVYETYLPALISTVNNGKQAEESLKEIENRDYLRMEKFERMLSGCLAELED